MGNFAEAINTLITRISRMDRRIKQLEREHRQSNREDDIGSFEPTLDNDFIFRNFDLITVKVTEVLSDTDFLGRPMIPQAGDSEPWVVDPDFTAAITITVPANGTMPAEDDVVSANFTGTYGTDPTVPRFILLGSGGGSSGREYVITEVNTWGNFLVCKTTVASVDGTSNVFIALPTDFRKPVWNGKTINSVTYAGTTSDPHFRLATNANSTALKQYEKILPSYKVGDIISGLPLAHNTTVVATYWNGTEITTYPTNIVDANVVGRAWVRVGEP